MSEQNKRERLRAIILENALITLDSASIVGNRGQSQDWMFDFRSILLNPGHANLIADIFWETYKYKYPFQVGGLEVAAIPIISAIVTKSMYHDAPINGFFIRKSRKQTGLQKMIEGEITDEPIILVDDLINSGNSFVRQLEVLESEGKNVADIYTLVSFRDLGAYDFASDRNIGVHSTFTLRDFDLKYSPREKKLLPREYFEVIWKFSSEKPNYFYVNPKSAPVIDETNMYVGSDNGTFWALDQENGEVAWKYNVGRPIRGKSIFSTPALHDGTVFFGSYDGNVYALQTKTGKKKWVFYEAEWIGSSPALSPNLGLVYIGLEFGLFRKKGGIAALDIETGEKKWEYIMPEYTHGSPLYIQEKNTVVIGSNDGKCYCFNAKTGKLLWEFQAGGEIKEAPTYYAKSNQVLFGAHDGLLYVLDLSNGNLVHAFETSFGIYSTPLVYKNTVIVGSLDKYVYCFDLDSHELKWELLTSGRIFASPELINDKIYIGSNDGQLREINPETGEETAFFMTTERIVNKVAYNEASGRFFVPTFANEIYCLKKN